LVPFSIQSVDETLILKKFQFSPIKLWSAFLNLLSKFTYSQFKFLGRRLRTCKWLRKFHFFSLWSWGDVREIEKFRD
jgi:hypothetical protein